MSTRISRRELLQQSRNLLVALPPGSLGPVVSSPGAETATSVASTFKNNSIFDLYNEPFTASWDCWLNGSTAANASPCTDVPFAVAGMQTLVNTVRATGAANVIMLGGLA